MPAPMNNYPPMGNYPLMGNYPPMGNYQSMGNNPSMNNFTPRPITPYGSSPYSGFSRYRYP